MSDNETTPWHSEDSIERYNSLFPILPGFVAHYTIGVEPATKVGLPDKYSLHLYEDILAALVADNLEISVAYAKKRYVKERQQSHWLGLTDRVDRIYDEGRKCFGWYVSSQRDLIAEDDDTLRPISIQFFYRNMGSLDAAKRLAELGYLCEVANILRSALEQLAFCSRLMASDGAEDIKSIRPLHCLNHLKKYVPAAGQLYGLLSKYTHFEYDHHTHFFTHGPGKIETIQKGPVLRAYSTHLLFVTMACAGQYLLNAGSVQHGDRPHYLNEIQAFIESIEKYSDDVCLMLPRDEILATVDILLQQITKIGNQ